MPTIFSTKDVDSVARALVQQYNQLHEDTVADDGYVHSDISGVISSGDWERPDSVALAVSAADASDLATLKTLVADLIGVYNVHLADDMAHRVADLTNPMDDDGYGVEPADLAECQERLNALQHRYNAHLSHSEGGVDVHLNDDSSNNSTESEATNQGTSETLANALKDDLNAHILEGPSCGKIKLI